MFETRMERHWGRSMRCYADRPATVDIMFREAVARTPDADALIDGSLRLTYRELGDRIDRVSAGLTARGVRPDDRVAVMMENRVEVVITVLALARLGAILLPVDIRLRKPEIAAVFADATPVAVIYSGVFAAELPADAPLPAMRFAVGDGGGFDALAACDDAAPAPAERDEEAAFAIIYTSGTTGRPKGAVLTNLGVVHTCLHWIDRLRLKQGDRSAVAAPWSHVAGLCGGHLADAADQRPAGHDAAVQSARVPAACRGA